MATLYRQYRPARFSDIAGQQHIVQTLQRAIKLERLAHAYLFHGPRGTGKTTTARILAKRLNCENPSEGEACDTCSSCRASRHQSLDVIEIDAASNRGIDDIRSLQQGIALKPTLGRYKVYIIDEVHMLTNEAFTALLKTLEEPIAHAIFILATTEFHKVPETIISRCQVYRFRRATAEEMRARLSYILKQEKREVTEDALTSIIDRSDGCFRDAESLLGQILSMHDKKITRDDVTEFLGLPPEQLIDDFLLALLQGTAQPAVAALDAVFDGGYDPEQFAQECIRVVREGALHIIAGTTDDWQFTKEATALARSPHIIRALVQALQDLAYVPQPLIALQLVILTLCAPTTRTGEATSATAINKPLAARHAKKAIQPTRIAAPTVPPTPASEGVKTESTSTTDLASDAGEAASIKALWPQVIAAVKNDNPVAATFLRAMEPVAFDGKIVRLQAFYALHRNFFDKAENKAIIERGLRGLLSKDITVQCFFTDPKSTAVGAPPQRQQEAELLQAVKEVFGEPAQPS